MRRSLLPLAATVALLAGCGGSSHPIARAVATPPAPTSTASTSASPYTRQVARAVYYLHDGGRGPRLYREFHTRTATTAVVRDAVTAMLTEQPYDGDYTSLWPRGTRVRGARVDGDVAYVDLSGEARRGSAGADGEAQSLQQLVHTVTAAAPAVRAVQLLIDGTVPATLWGHVDTRQPVRRGPPAQVLGAVWVSLPDGVDVRQGSAVRGEASVFEATVSYEWRQGGRVVRRGFTNATEGAPGRGAWSAPADVPPGRYVLRAFESSAKDGSPQQVDDKTVVVTG